ncbi:MAG: preprotein translocase subunit SecD [Eubacterium sp.]
MYSFETTNSQFDGYYKVWLTGEHVSDAVGQAETDSKTGKHQNVVNLKFDSEGTKAFGDMTSQNVNKTSYIIYDNEVLSYPTINQAITGGQAQITGGFDLKEAETLASNIKIGALDLSLEELSHNVQSATLGRDALSKSIQAGIIGFIIIAIFMLLVYRIPGIAAALALFSYLELMLLALNGFAH